MANARDVKSPQQIVDALGTEGGDVVVCDAVSAFAKDGRFVELADLARTLEATSKSLPKGAVESHELVVDHIEDQLALSPDSGAVDALFALSLEPREHSVAVPRPRSVRLRAFGSRLGYGQETKEFVTALERHSGRADHEELLACWMHEVILRGTSLEDEPRAVALSEALKRSGHPLGGLPLSLLATEREVPSYMPLYGDKGLGRAIDALTSGLISIRSIPPPADATPVEAKVIADDVVSQRLAKAVEPWLEGKNGKVETKLFSLARRLETSSLGRSFLRTLSLDSASGASQLDVSRTGAEGAFGPLFSAASNGGAYSTGLGGAHGRLAAWTSLGALVGAEASADVATIDDLASRSAFLVFRAEGGWFHDVAWDLGVLALRPGGLSAAVIAATDNE